ncbi:hypothetical protein V2G26_013541 [Clonostachys chloroleuca]
MTCELPAETRCKCIAPAANPSAISALPGQPSFSHHPLPSPLSTRFAVSFAPPPPVLTNTTEFYDLSIFCSTSPLTAISASRARGSGHHPACAVQSIVVQWEGVGCSG